MGRPRGSLQNGVAAAAQAGGTLAVVGALGMAVAVVVMPVVADVDALAFQALAVTARALAAVGMGEAVNPLAAATRAGRAVNTLATAAGTGRAVNTLATAAGTGRAVNTLATAAGTGRAVNTLATAAGTGRAVNTLAAVSRVSTPVITPVVAMPTAIAPLTSSMRVIRITLPIVATAARVRGRNISARSKAVGMVVPVSRRAGFPLVAQAVSGIARAADGQAVGGKFYCGGPVVGATHASHG